MAEVDSRRSEPQEPDIELDLGDITLSLTARVKRLAPPHLTWRLGPFTDTVPSERTPGTAPTYKYPAGKVDLNVDLKADQKVSFALEATDEVGNPATFDGTIEFAIDDPSIATLTDNGDGSGEVAATGTLGVTNLTGTATRNSDGQVFTGAAVINVIAGDAETFNIEFGTPEEVTPDEPTP